jgi:hypothetical protein
MFSNYGYVSIECGIRVTVISFVTPCDLVLKCKGFCGTWYLCTWGSTSECWRDVNSGMVFLRAWVFTPSPSECENMLAPTSLHELHGITYQKTVIWIVTVMRSLSFWSFVNFSVFFIYFLFYLCIYLFFFFCRTCCSCNTLEFFLEGLRLETLYLLSWTAHYVYVLSLSAGTKALLKTIFNFLFKILSSSPSSF